MRALAACPQDLRHFIKTGDPSIATQPLLTIACWILLAWLTIAAATSWRFRRQLLGLWREPVLRSPILIIESDDWGAGPLEQAQALGRLSTILTHYLDRTGRHPVMTLAVVLGVADTEAMSIRPGYRHKTLELAEFDGVRKAMLSGVEAGVFTLQLHGMEHYWPTSLLAAAAHDPVVAAWLTGPPLPATESLPSALQSRWVETYPLPSRTLSRQDIDAAAKEEVAVFREVFGFTPRVVVPPTFVWEPRVERAWARAGVAYCVTPGRRYQGRDSIGAPALPGPRLHNAQPSPGGLTYLVRERYFEPSRGHRAERVLTEVDKDMDLGRPTLLETHRYNFLGTSAEACLAELESMLEQVTKTFPEIRFISTEALADFMQQRAPEWVETRPLPRLRVWLRRIQGIPRFGRLARLGLYGLPLSWMQWLVQPRTKRNGNYGRR